MSGPRQALGFRDGRTPASLSRKLVAYNYWPRSLSYGLL